MDEKKKAPSDQKQSDFKLLNSIALSGFAEVIWDVDCCLRPFFIELALLVAIQEVVKERGLTPKEQLHIWRPFDV